MGFIGFIASIITPIIIILAIGMLFFVAKNASDINSHFRNIEAMLNQNKVRSTYDKTTGEVKDEVVTEIVTPDIVREGEKHFNKAVATYNVISQLVSIFPLLGIFGTVLGLLVQLSSNSIDTIYSSLNTALGSTAAALLGAIVLKCILAMVNGRTIEIVENMLEDYYKKFEISIKTGHYSE